MRLTISLQIGNVLHVPASTKTFASLQKTVRVNGQLREQQFNSVIFTKKAAFLQYDGIILNILFMKKKL